MDQRAAPEFILDAFADPTTVRDVVRGILHTIFFHRYFPSIAPRTFEVLELTLPYVGVPALETMIDQRTTTLMRQLDTERQQQSHKQSEASHVTLNDANTKGFQHGQGRGPMADDLDGGVAGSLASRTGANRPSGHAQGGGGGRGQITIRFFEKVRRKAWVMRGEEEVCWECWTVKVTVAEPRNESERAKVRKATESTLHNTIMKIVTSVNAHKDHIPPITTTEVNPFPYQITVNQKESGWATRMGIYG